MKLFRYILPLIFLSLSPISSPDENHFCRRIRAHIIIGDYKSSIEESVRALESFPGSAPIYESYVRALALSGKEREMLQVWGEYIKRFPESKGSRDLIEDMCWGVLGKASVSPSLTTRLMSLLAGFFSRDVRGTAILRKGMYDPNAVIRAAALELAGQLHDTKLIDGVKDLFLTETNWSIRQSVLKAIGSMKIKELSPGLETIIASDRSSAEEKALAIHSLVQLLDEIKGAEMARLASSDRAGLRLLACRAAAHFRLERDVDLLLISANDNHSSVRAAAIQALGLIRPLGEKSLKLVQLAKEKIEDPDFKVALSAAWLLTLYSPVEGKEAIAPYLDHDRQEVRLLAAAALKSTGKYGVELAARRLSSHSDPLVRLNLALGLMPLRVSVDEAGQVIHDVLALKKENWSEIKEGIFEAVAPQTSRKSSLESSPEVDNQVVRLGILGALATVHPKKAQDSVRHFLLERSWGVSGAAAALLLTEGNEAAADLVRNLLGDENHRVRVQAAIILSLWSHDEKAIVVLQESYAVADKDTRERILESIGRIGSMSSVPFLLDILREPSQHVRIIAATALIQCLNH
jgi:HEAT repeat protein